MESHFRASGRFELLREIGEGGNGIVFEAVDREGGQRLALKSLRRLDPQALYRFKHEFRALQGLQHPNLVHLGELFEEEGHWFYTMELIEGEDFLAYVRPGAMSTSANPDHSTLPSLAPLSRSFVDIPTDQVHREVLYDEQRLRSSLGQLATALTTLHALSKVHRDIKPTNIRVSPEGRLVLLDFGLLTETSGLRESNEMQIVGTAAYMAPEQAASKPVGPAVDWYSFGVLLYESLTGRLPYTGTAVQICMDKQRFEPVPPRAYVPDVAPDLDSLCVELLRFDPRSRPSGEQVLKRLGLAPAKGVTRISTSEYSRTGVFVGRDRELDVLHRAFQLVQSGEAISVLIHGESGIGKSELLRHFSNQITDEQGATVLYGRCYERESVPFKAFDGVVDSLSRVLRGMPRSESLGLLPRYAALLPRLFPVLGRVKAFAEAPVLRTQIDDPRELRRHAFAALRELLTRLVSHRPIVAVIEDIQWADRDSLRLLSELTRAPDPPSILLLMTSRVAPTAEGSTAQIAQLLSGRLQSLQLSGLELDAAAQLASQLLVRAGLEDDRGPQLAKEAAGHPLFIDELARHAAVPGTSRGEGTIRLDDAIRDRISQLDPDAILLIELVCVAGEPVSQEIVLDAAELPYHEFARQLSVLRVAHLVRGGGARATDRVEPYHDRIREAVLATMTREGRLSRHRQLAVALESSRLAAEQPELLLRHLEASGQTDKAARYAQQAARRSYRALAFDRASELYRMAIRLGNYDTARLRTLQYAVADSLAHAGRASEAADAFLAAAEDADPSARLEAMRNAAEQFLCSGYVDRGLGILERVLGEVGQDLPRSGSRALAALAWRRLRLRLRGYKWEPRHESLISAHDLRLSDVYRTASISLALIDPIVARHFQTRGLLLNLRLGERARTIESLLYEVAFLGAPNVSSTRRARRLFAEVAREVRALKDPRLIAIGLTAEGILNHFAQDLDRAARRFRKAEEIYTEHAIGDWSQINVLHTFRTLNLRRTGEVKHLGQLFIPYLRDAERRGDRFAETTLRRVCSLVWLARDQPEEAKHQLELNEWMPISAGVHLQHYWELLARGEIALYEGQAAQALERLAETFQRILSSTIGRTIQTSRLETIWLLGRMRLSCIKSNDPGALAPVVECVRRLAREKGAYAQIWAAMLEAGVANRLGNSPRATQRLQYASEAAEAASFRLCAAAAQLRLGALIGGERGVHLVAAATRFFDEQKVAAPRRLTDVMCPGFE
ncbi:MAG: AAA family ATPase [Myxococcales bacterium]|nr:AAA family ATPase [Myxococcales bacterium]